MVKTSYLMFQKDIAKAKQDLRKAQKDLQSLCDQGSLDTDRRGQVQNCCQQQTELLSDLVDLSLRIQRQEIILTH